MLGSPENKLVRLDECRQRVRDECCHFDNHLCALLGDCSPKKMCDMATQQQEIILNKKKRKPEHELLRMYAHQTVVAVADGSEGIRAITITIAVWILKLSLIHI